MRGLAVMNLRKFEEAETHLKEAFDKLTAERATIPAGLTPDRLVDFGLTPKG